MKRVKMNSKMAMLVTIFAMIFTFNACSDDNNDDGNSNNSSGINTVKIGNQIWMAENLNYNVPRSKCYGEGDTKITLSSAEIQANCDKYGRLYDLATAMALPPYELEQVNEKHQGICPSGWHLPSKEDWAELIDYVENDKECTNCAGKYLKATSGWNSYNGESGNGLDTYGFSAIGSLWSASLEYYRAYGLIFQDEGAHVLVVQGLLSVRCLKD